MIPPAFAVRQVRFSLVDCSPSYKNLMHFAEVMTLHEGLLHNYTVEVK